jgi:Ca2+-binding RTX toxin-like protein
MAIITGNNFNNLLQGTAAADQIFGLAGIDILKGGGGADLLDGGSGTDTVLYGDSTVGVQVDLAVGQGSGGTAQGDTFISVENVGGSAHDDLLVGNNAANELTGGNGDDVLAAGGGADRLIGGIGSDVLDGGSGDDQLEGGAGDDVYIHSGFDVVVELAGEGIDEVRTTNNFMLPANVERLVLLEGGGASEGRGNALDNVVTGNSFANTLSGGDGNDILIGGGGDDIYLFNPPDTVVEEVGGGFDELVVSGSASLAGIANVEGLRLMPTAFLGDLTGNELDNRLVGSILANILDGGAGVDTLIGGAGGDTYRLDTVLDLVVEAVGQGQDRVEVTFSGYTLASNVEVGVVAVATGAALAGNELDNILFGNVGSDTLNGGQGNDQFDGGLGNDDIVGGADNDALGGNQGLDALTGGTGNDTLTGGADDDRFVFFVGDGLDIITDFTAGDGSAEFIELRGFGFANFAQLQPLMSQQGADVLIGFDANNAITLQNVTLASLNQGDFVFA